MIKLSRWKCVAGLALSVALGICPLRQASAQTPLAHGRAVRARAVRRGHRVARRRRGPKEVWFDTPLDTFRTQLDAIARGGFHVVTLDTLRAHLERGAPLPQSRSR